MGLGISIAVDGFAEAPLAEATLVEVEERMGEATTYRLNYAADIEAGDLPLLVDGRLDAGSDISVLVPTDSGQQCLVKGPVTGQRIHLQHGGAGSTVIVQGADTTITMDREAKSQVWTGLTDSDAVSAILANYGYVPDVESTTAGHYEAKHTLIQRGTDLYFVQQLARRNGFLFWVTCDEFGVETAHFKRPPLDALSGTELIINLASPNVQQLDIEWDVERPTSVETLQLDLNTKSDIEGRVSATPQTLLGSSGLADITGDTRSQFLTAPSDDAGDLVSRSEGALIESDWFIRASCQTSLAVLRQLVRAHTVVKVRGAGRRHSGNYFVSSVRHAIDDVSHRMEIELLRNAWGG
jgi:hypothetical protein